MIETGSALLVGLLVGSTAGILWARRYLCRERRVILPTEFPAEDLVLSPLVVANGNGTINVIDQATGKAIRFAGVTVATWHFAQRGCPEGGSRLVGALDNPPIVRAEDLQPQGNIPCT